MAYRPTAEELSMGLDSVHYEFEQLVDRLARTAGHSAVDNAVVESLLLHVRILRDFFEFDSRKQDDILATHYGFPLSPIKIDEPYIDRLHKDLAHLTYARTKRTLATKSWPVDRVAVPVVERCSEFIAHVLEPRNVSVDVARTKWRGLEARIRDLLDVLEK